MKIKTKKQLNLPQLIEWGFNNPELAKGRIYNINDAEARFAPYVSFPGGRTGVRVPSTITHDDTFTVEVEEEITEDTVLPKLVKYTCNSYYEHRDKSINMLDRAKEWSTFYYKDDNENMHLIWRDGKLVE